MLMGQTGDDALIQELSQHTKILVNATNLSADTRYYPDSSGLDLMGYKDINYLLATSGGVTVTFEAGDGTTWVDITKSGNSLLNNAKGAANFADQTDIISFLELGMRYIRVKSVTSDGSNAVKIVARYKSL